MKTPDFLKSLPSVNDLLEDPRVRSVADRLSRSVVTTRVRGYLEQIAAEAKRRSADLSADAAAGVEDAIGAVLPDSMRDLVNRVSRYLTQGDRWRVGVAINATGRLRGGPWASAPLSDAAIERLLLAASEFTAGPIEGPHRAGGVDAADALCLATGAPAAAVFNSHTAALWLGLAAAAEPVGTRVTEGAGERDRVVVARGDLRTLEDGVRVADLIERAGLRVVEVGASDTATLDDYVSAVDDRTAAVLRVADEDAWPAPQRGVSIAELATLTHQHGALLIEDSGGAPLVGVSQENPPLAAVADALAAGPVAASVLAGADLVVVRGDGLVGGPACGLVVGRESVVGQLLNSPLAPALAAEPHIASAVAATIDQLLDGDRFWFGVPAWSLLSTPIENLAGRAERLAARLNALDGVASAEAVRHAASEAPPTGLPIRLPTVVVAVIPAEGSAEELDALLRGNDPALWPRRDAEGRLVLDLRTVFPRQDGEVLNAIAAVFAEQSTG